MEIIGMDHLGQPTEVKELEIARTAGAPSSIKSIMLLPSSIETSTTNPKQNIITTARYHYSSSIPA